MTASLSAVSAACTYELDERLCLVAVDAAWTSFAVANGALALVPPAPLGRSIFSFMADPTTIHIYQQLFQRVAATGTPVEFTLRCDAPAQRRLLQLRVEGSQGGFHLSSSVVRTESRPPQELLEPDLAQANTFLRICSWCKKVDVDGTWLEVEDAVARLTLFERARLPHLTHGMCEPCYEVMRLLTEG